MHRTDPTKDRYDRIRELAQRFSDFGVHVDSSCAVREEGNGAYVQAWVYVSFINTDLDKEKKS